ncbi:MAG: DUF721 domain-containing protein [Prevotellaceae bacterium]|jgi:hypothetical protein|nr:DUF721 domain-containing protein [Prevotellaceae bacterium]
MEKKEPKSLSQNMIMSSLRAIYGDEFYYNFLESNLITEIIPNVLGNALCAYFSEMKFENQVLYIKVNSAPLRSNLIMQRTALISRLNSEAGVSLIKNISFR